MLCDGLTIRESDIDGHYIKTVNGPVSYTHLDVYKRQGLHEQTSIRLRLLCRWISII